jgi:hypothetical protein
LLCLLDEVHVVLEDAEAVALLAVVPVRLLPSLVQVPQGLLEREVAFVERDGAAAAMAATTTARATRRSCLLAIVQACVMY